jgi:hypothetical protein
MSDTYVIVADLPAPVALALKQLGYARKDIRLEVGPTVSPFIGGGAGQRGFFCAVTLQTGRSKTRWGSWGGANMFNLQNQVDLDDAEYPIPSGVMVLKGDSGMRTWATLYVRPDEVAPLLPPAPAELSIHEQAVLYAYGALKSCDYRKEMLAKVPAGVVDSMVELGYIKRSSNGAAQITTKGKNA